MNPADPLDTLSPLEIAKTKLALVADRFRGAQEWGRALHLTRPHSPADHLRAEALNKTRATAALAGIGADLSANEATFAHLLLVRSPRMQQEPEIAALVVRLLTALSPSQPHFGLASCDLRTTVEKIACEYPGLLDLLRLRLEATDRALFDTILAHGQATGGDADLQRQFDDHSHAAGIPSEYWWAYPARTVRTHRAHANKEDDAHVAG